MSNSTVRMIETSLASVGVRIVLTSYERAIQLNRTTTKLQHSGSTVFQAVRYTTVSSYKEKAVQFYFLARMSISSKSFCLGAFNHVQLR